MKLVRGLHRALAPSDAVPEISSNERGVHYGLLLLRHYFNKPDLFRSLEQRWLHPSLENRSAPLGNQEFLELERFDESELRTHEQFAALFQKKTRPVVIEGGARRIKSIQKWNATYFSENYNEIKVPVNFKDKTNDTRKLGEIIRGIRKGELESVYIENVSDLIGEHIELEKALDIDSIQNLIGSRYLNSQIFIGGPKSGSNFHCGAFTTFFLMLEGEKEWTFAHPRHTLWMYPRVSPASNYLISGLLHLLEKDELAERFPLYERIPKYKAIIREGDALFLPSYWWHAVTNLSPITVAVSTRWGYPKWAANPVHPNAVVNFVFKYSKLAKRARLEAAERKRAGKRGLYTDQIIKKELRHGFSHFCNHT